MKSLNALLRKSGQPEGRLLMMHGTVEARSFLGMRALARAQWRRSGAQLIQRTSPMEPKSRIIRPELYFSNVSILSA